MKKIANKIKEQDAQFNFIPKLVAQLGYPNWKAVQTNIFDDGLSHRTNTTDTAYNLIPFQLNGEVTGMLNCIDAPDSLRFVLSTKTQSIATVDQNDYIVAVKGIERLRMIAALEKIINNKDSLVFPNHKLSKVKGATLNIRQRALSGRDQVEILVETCGWETVQFNGWQYYPGAYGNVWVCRETIYWLANTGSSGNNLQTLESILGDFSSSAWWNVVYGGGGGGAGTGIVFAPTTNNINSLLNNELKFSERILLDQNPGLATQILNYLNVSSFSRKTLAAKFHISKLAGNFSYFSMVQNHLNSTNGALMTWWDDKLWLSHNIDLVSNDAANLLSFSLNAEDNKKPIEYLLKANGLMEMSTATKNDNKERLGYLTYDDKYFFADVANESVVNARLYFNGLTAYYIYPKALGLPTLIHTGMITLVDEFTESEMVLIPVRVSTHVHPKNQVSIDSYGSLSEADMDLSSLTEKLDVKFKHFVIEVWVTPMADIKYKVGSFHNLGHGATSYNDVILTDDFNIISNKIKF